MQNQDPNCLPRVVAPASVSLTDLETALLQNAHRGYDKVIIEKEFRGGYGGTRVFLVLPVHSNGASDARVVTKIGPAHDLHHEFQNYEKYAGRALPFTAAQVREPFEQAEWAALNYVFVGDADLGKSLTLEDYYHTHTAADVIKTIENLFDKALGPKWYRQSQPLNCSFREEYGRHLPSHQEFEEIVQKVFSQAISPDGSQVIIPGISDPFPNPLHHYADLLDKTLMGRKSFVHGDLHLRNVLVDEGGKAWLIDFAKVGERHNLFDFIKLEVYMRLMTLAREHGAFSLNEYMEFEQALNLATMDQSTAIPSNPKLKFAYQVILSIRESAGNYMADRHSFKQEYLSALFLYALATMKYHSSNGDVPTRLIFMTVCMLAKGLLEDDMEGIKTPQNSEKGTSRGQRGKNRSTRPGQTGGNSQGNMGGVNIRGSVNIDHGDIVGRDKIINTVLPTTRCYICGKLCHADEAYRCQRCKQDACISHRLEKDSPLCPDCAKRVKLERLLTNRDDDTRLNAIQLLSKIGDTKTIRPIKNRLEVETNPFVRYWLYFTLGHISGKEAEKILKNSLRLEADAFVRQGIEEGLQQIAAKKIP